VAGKNLTTIIDREVLWCGRRWEQWITQSTALSWYSKRGGGGEDEVGPSSDRKRQRSSRGDSLRVDLRNDSGGVKNAPQNNLGKEPL